MSTDHNGHGYVDCSCRDCFNVAVCSARKGITNFEAHLCSDCREHECTEDSECSVPPEDDRAECVTCGKLDLLNNREW